MSLHIATDPAHGGRWTSLKGRRTGVAVARPHPRAGNGVAGDAFVDAGGPEERVRTVRGTPDHGAARSRAWTTGEDDARTVRCGRHTPCSTPGPDDDARVPASGEVRWRLTLAAGCRCAPTDV